MILVIDNFDSFVYNLARYIEQLGVETHVARNDAISVREVQTLKPKAIVLSPGPCTPSEAGCSLELVREFHQTLPMLGVCLGHQTIAQALGGKVVRSEWPWHGRESAVTHNGRGVFAGLPQQFSAGRYHSLEVEVGTLPDELEANAWTTGDVIMGIQHKSLRVFGVQFHPESILTECGYHLLDNFLELSAIPHDTRATELQQHELSVPESVYQPPNRPVTF